MSSGESSFDKRWLVLAVLVGVAWYLWNGPVSAPLVPALEQAFEAPVRFDPALSVEREPIQRDLDSNPLVPVENYQFTLMAEFEVEARVLGRRDYRRDGSAEISPIDLALGWGPMARDELLEKIDISQSRRWYRTRWTDRSISNNDVSRHSSNMHMIPASERVFSTLKRVGENDVVRLRGFLVNVDRDDGWRWRTSLNRTDTGDGACEIVLVTRASIM